MGWSKRDKGVWSAPELVNPHGRADKGEKVQAMFNGIARRYDLANTVISFGQAGIWRSALTDMVAAGGHKPTMILDLCCGTGAMMPVLARRFAGARIVGADFAEQMLRLGERRFPSVAADALALPFCNGTFDLITCTFGLRNLQSLETGLREISRVLRPGGMLAVLEFQPPERRILRPVFNAYFKYLLPVIGAAVTRSFGAGAYDYLPRSVQSWYTGDLLVKYMQESGFTRVRVRKLCLGAVWALTAIR